MGDMNLVTMVPAADGWRAVFLDGTAPHGYWVETLIGWGIFAEWEDGQATGYRDISGMVITEGGHVESVRHGGVVYDIDKFFWRYLAPGEKEPSEKVARKVAAQRDEWRKNPPF